MIISVHTGAHATHSHLLLRALLRNKALLAAQGVEVPGPGRYRQILPQVVSRLRGARASADSCEMLVDMLSDQDEAARIVLSYENILADGANIFRKGGFYANAPARLRALRNVFPQAQVEFHISLREPGHWLQALSQALSEADGLQYDSLLAGNDPAQISWAALITAIKSALPETELTVWCAEDAPLICPAILQRIAGLTEGPNEGLIEGLTLAGSLDLIAGQLNPEGLRRLRLWLAQNPPASESERRQVLRAFLDKYARPETPAPQTTLPGWDPALQQQLRDNYQRDQQTIAAMDGVTFLTA
jgi:hypothetical protein